MPISKKHLRTIDEYIEPSPKNMQSIRKGVRQIIKKAAPEAEEAISYQIPTFKLKGNYLVYFAAFKKQHSGRKYLHMKVLRVISNSRSINLSH